ncbi:hypothetical protein ACFXAW_25180 [Streptomyces sp. NPDC059445]|uniref:hypothetical protein n=1 Tax=unclassified Streptomyces TaxID=2593676 RepID=UPI0036C1DD8C
MTGLPAAPPLARLAHRVLAGQKLSSAAQGAVSAPVVAFAAAQFAASNPPSGQLADNGVSLAAAVLATRPRARVAARNGSRRSAS